MTETAAHRFRRTLYGHVRAAASRVQVRRNGADAEVLSQRNLGVDEVELGGVLA